HPLFIRLWNPPTEIVDALERSVELTFWHDRTSGQRNGGVSIDGRRNFLLVRSIPNSLTFLAGKNACPTLWQFVEEADHFEGRLGAFLALVAGVAAGAVNSLFNGVAGEHAKQHRKVRFQSDFAHAHADLP